MTPATGMSLALLATCLLLVALFAASEAALAATNRVRLRHLLRAQSGEEVGSASSDLSSDATNFIATVTIAANVPLVAASALALRLGWFHFGARGAGLLSAGIALLSLTLFQVTPRLMISSPRALDRHWWVRPARVMVALLHPLVGLLLWLGRALLGPLGLLQAAPERDASDNSEEIRDLVESANGSGEWDESKELIESIFTFGDTRVHEVMIPRPDIVALPLTSSAAEAIEKFQSSGLSRLPLFEGSVDQVAGILHVKDVLGCIAAGELDFSPASLLRAPLYLPETRKIDDALAAMRAQRTHLAIVMDEFGGTAGLLTVEDVLEELVGEIADEHDVRDEALVILDAHRALADARLHTDDLADQFGLTLPAGEFDTIGGIMIERLGRALAVGDVLEMDDATLTVNSMRGRRPKKIMIARRPPNAALADDAPLP